MKKRCKYCYEYYESTGVKRHESVCKRVVRKKPVRKSVKRRYNRKKKR